MLSVESLSKSFGETQVLKNINLDIPSGETTVILGPSGSGKSTLLRCLNLLEPRSPHAHHRRRAGGLQPEAHRRAGA